MGGGGYRVIDGSGTGGAIDNVTYAYDVLGRRVGKTTLDSSTGNATTTYYVYSGDRVIEERNEDDEVVASYVYGLYVDEVLQMRRDVNDDDTPEDYYFHSDDLYNTIALTALDAAGNVYVVERYDYGHFGEPIILDPDYTTQRAVSAVDNPYLFTGRQWDAETGLYDYRTRYYDPKLGRFLSRDSIGIWGDAANMGNAQAYVNNNPWSCVDPYGRQTMYGISYYLDDGEFKTIEPCGFFEFLHVSAFAYDQTVGAGVRRLDPNPGPISCSLAGQIFVDRTDEVDIIENRNNALYTGTEVAMLIGPAKLLKPLKSIPWIGRVLSWFNKADKAVDVVTDVNKGTRAMMENADEGVEFVENALKKIDDVPSAGKLNPCARGGLPGLHIDMKQFGKKIGKHAGEFGLDPADPAAREFLLERIQNIVGRSDEIRRGPWRGGAMDNLFFREGSDVVVTKSNGEFVTILKDGADSSWFKNAGDV